MKVVILAGGSGTRLWPISRTNYPKQFLKIKGQEQSLFQQTIKRALMLVEMSGIYIVTNEKYKYFVSGQIEEIGLDPIESNILLEPESKNTLPAITFAVQEIEKSSLDIVAVFSSDHLINEEEQFIATIRNAEYLANKYILLFGVKPNQPHTGYGYIKPGSKIGNESNSATAYIVAEFVEKPNKETAIDYLEQGYLWNSGMFMFSTKLFLEELKKGAPEVFNAFLQQNNHEKFQKSPSVSVDYGLLEKTKQVAVIPFNVSWSDLGSFDSIYDQYVKDDNNNLQFNNEILINSSNNFLYTDKDKAVALIGVDDLIVIEEKDALLISKRDQSQHVKSVVEKLRERQDKRTEEHITTYRPWGSYTILEEGLFYKIKRITVLPNKKLSYQMHHHRSEHWVVVQGTAKVILEGEEKLVLSGESTFVKAGSKHRLENPGKTPLEVIEVQLGEYLNEDDIIRIDDDFGREM